MGKAWEAIQSLIKEGKVIRKELRKQCKEKKDINVKTFDANIKRNVKSGHLGTAVFRKNGKKEDVLILEEEELWQTLQRLKEKVKNRKNVSVSVIRKRETVSTETDIVSQYYVSVENAGLQVIEKARARILLIDLSESKVLHDHEIAWPQRSYETDLLKGFLRELIAFEVCFSPRMLGGREERYRISISSAEKRTTVDINRPCLLLVEIYAKDCYGAKGFFLHGGNTRHLQTFELVEIKSASYHVPF